MNYRVTITVGARELHVGDIAGGTFYKKVNLSKHLFKKTDSFGLDAERFKQVISRCKEILIYETEEKILYRSTPEQWEKHGNYFTFQKHRKKIFLSRVYHTKQEIPVAPF
jgi:hypothetical protein